MKISNRTKRNLQAILVLVGCGCIASRLWDVIVTPSSGKAWFELCSIIFLTVLCFGSFLTYYRRVKSGIIYGDK